MCFIANTGAPPGLVLKSVCAQAARHARYTVLIFKLFENMLWEHFLLLQGRGRDGQVARGARARGLHDWRHGTRGFLSVFSAALFIFATIFFYFSFFLLSTLLRDIVLFTTPLPVW